MLHHGEAVGEAVTLVSRVSEASEAKYPILVQLEKNLTQLPTDQKIDLLLQMLTTDELQLLINSVKSQIVWPRYNLPVSNG